jgi:aspartyl-tRNA(Asn)/glutamyl-tRNA(Gln) amidotransferase subunit A
MTAPIPSLAEASRGIASGEFTPSSLARNALDRIAALEPELHAFITITADRALAAAARAEAEIKAGRKVGPLHGVPYALKDIYDVAGIRTTAHSKLLENNIAKGDSDATERLEGAGMVLLGKLSTHEFARGGPSDKLPWPNARNPWNTDHFAGGSSSGAGVSVAAGMVALAMGSDTGGSIRTPAACNGIVGLKPTYGRLSRRGVVPLSFSMDHAGPLTRTVEDCAMALQVLAGHDPLDPASANRPVENYLAHLKDGVRGLRIGRARAYDEQSGVDAEQMAATDAVAAQLRELGAEVVEIELPDRKLLDAMTWAIVQAEGYAVHQHDLRTRPQDYGRVTRERLMIGAFTSVAQYVQAQRLRPILSAQLDKILAGCDAILCSALSSAPPRLADVDEGPWRPQQPITGPFNGTGHPAMSIPAGFAANGLPLAAQLVGPAFREAGLLRIAHAYEQAAGWYLRRPALALAAA